MALQPRPVVIPSADRPGKTWQVTYIKHEGQPGMFVAVEGEFNDLGQDGAYAVSTFKYEPFNCRRVRKQLAGRASKPKLQALYRELLAEMREQGLIPQKQEVAA